jgi:hypothetical protein
MFPRKESAKLEARNSKQYQMTKSLNWNFEFVSDFRYSDFEIT